MVFSRYLPNITITLSMGKNGSREMVAMPGGWDWGWEWEWIIYDILILRHSKSCLGLFWVRVGREIDGVGGSGETDG